MKKTRTPDFRPAIAFDEKKEVQLIVIALTLMEISTFPRPDKKKDYTKIYIRKLRDEIKKCEKMFNKKEK